MEMKNKNKVDKSTIIFGDVNTLLSTTDVRTTKLDRKPAKKHENLIHHQPRGFNWHLEKCNSSKIFFSKYIWTIS
jgi:hypothetical protein